MPMSPPQQSGEQARPRLLNRLWDASLLKHHFQPIILIVKDICEKERSISPNTWFFVDFAEERKDRC